MEARDRRLRRSSWLPRLARLPRLTGGRPVVCMGVFLCFYECAHRRAARIRACMALVTLICAGAAGPHGARGVRAPSHRHAVTAARASRLFVRPKQRHREFRF
jgi:hypothetical protein